MYRLLIIEDEFFSRQALLCSIEACYPQQFEILSVDNGLDALDLCQHSHPDIVLVDLNIPGISGLNLIQTLNDYNFTGKLIITTAYNRANYIREALSLGVCRYLLKPINTEELKNALDKCISLIKDEQTSENSPFDSLFSYAQSYLIRDILNCHAPQKLLTDIYGWSENGSLNAGFLLWCPDAKTSIEEKYSFLNTAEKLLDFYFLILSATIDGKVLLFLHAKKHIFHKLMPDVLSASLSMLRKTYPQGSLLISKFSTTYTDLYTAVKQTLFIAEHEQSVFFNPNAAHASLKLTSTEERLRIRQKFVQRILERQTVQLVQYLKRKLESCAEPYIWFSLFLEALEVSDPDADLCSVLKLFHAQNWHILLENWLNEYYKSKTIQYIPVSKSQQALEIIKNNFSQDLTQETLATMLGLTPTYFSSIFKKETGKSFPQYLTEFRIQHAKELIDKGEHNIEKIATECGFNNKKYFLELFKKFSGSTFTQYLNKKLEGDFS